MKTLWNEVNLIDRYFDQRLSDEETATFEGRMDTDVVFKANVLAQSYVRRLVNKYYYIQLRKQARILHSRLYNDPARRHMRQAIEALFKN
jgi:hypothetical protein